MEKDLNWLKAKIEAEMKTADHACAISISKGGSFYHIGAASAFQSVLKWIDEMNKED